VHRAKARGGIFQSSGATGWGVSLGGYAISDLDQKIEAVTKLESEVIEAPKNGDIFGFGSFLQSAV